MADFSSSTLFPPKDWQQFERKVRLLFEHSLRDPHTQNNGRQGQAQQGVDVFGRRGGGNGPMVGVQCKGKDANFGGLVTEDELRQEVSSSSDFRPELKEFILVTTAPDDAKIQEVARLLEVEIRGSGRDLSISVWGWGRLQEEIIRFPEVTRAFQPDATPHTDRIYNELAEINAILQKQANIGPLGTTDEGALKPIAASAPTQIATESQSLPDALDQFVHNQIDTYRDYILEGQAKTAIDLLTRLKDQVWVKASERVRFRILGNLGAANHRLARYESAADFFLEAAPYRPDDPAGIANKVAALLIKGRAQEAHEIAVEAFRRFPGNADIALQRLQACSPVERVEDVWAQLSADTREKPEIIVQRVVALRTQADPSWQLALKEDLRHDPTNLKLRALNAETILDRLIKNDPGAVGLQGADTPNQTELSEAADAFEAMWNSTLGTEAKPDVTFGHNTALARHILRQDDHASRLLDVIIAQGLANDESRRLRIVLYLRKGMKEEAIKLADQLADNPHSKIIRADLRLSDAPSLAREILADRDTYADRKDIITAALTVVDSYLSESNYVDALAEAQRLKGLLPTNPHSTLCIYNVKRANGDADAHQALTEAMRRLDERTDFATRFFVADALGKAGRPDEVVDVLNTRTSTAFDSPALRTLVAAAANSDRRSTLSDLLEKLPPSVTEISFYQSAKIALAVKSGDVQQAEVAIRAYLAQRPRNLEIHLQLMHALFRQNKIDELRTEAARPASAFDGEPLDYMKLAQFKDSFADWREAHELAYKTLLGHPNDPDVNIGYAATFLSPGHSKELEVSPTVVTENQAVSVVPEAGPATVYIIEPDPSLRPTPQYIPTNHEIAARLIGNQVGSEIKLPDGSKGKIDWAKPKVLHALHEILENFQNFFPGIDAIQRVPVSSELGGFQPILDKVRQRHDATERVAEVYDAGNFPIVMVGKLLGIGPAEAFYGLVSTGHTIRVCGGAQEERNAAFAAIDTNAGKGCVVDALTLQAIRGCGLEDAVTKVCGPIGITATTALRVKHNIHELEQRINEPDMSMFWRDGQYYRQELAPAQKQNAVQELKNEAAWLAKHTAILPATGTKDPSPAVRDLLRSAGSEIADDILAAQGSGCLLVSDDQAFRTLAGLEFSTASSWLQPILMKALEEKHLDRNRYVQAVTRFIDCRYEFVTLDAATVVASLTGVRGHSLPGDFLKMASRLGGANANLPSHMSVAMNVIVLTWSDNRLTEVVRQAIVGKLIENLIRACPLEQVTTFVREFFAFGRGQLGDAAFAGYLSGWLKGHFIKI